MDWSKAKNILITLLLALNATLLATVVGRAVDTGASRRIYGDVAQILEKRGVRMLCEFPKDVRDSELLIYEDSAGYMAALAGRLAGGAGTAGAGAGSAGAGADSAGSGAAGAGAADSGADGTGAGGSGAAGAAAGGLQGAAEVRLLGRAALAYRNPSPAEALAVADDAALDSGARAALEAKGIDLSQFGLDSLARGDSDGDGIDDGGARLFYVQRHGGKPVFDSTVAVSVSASGGISAIEVRHRAIKDVSQDRQMSVVPAYQVVLKHYAGGGQAIRSIDIGFMGQDEPSESPLVESEEGAVWRVRTDDGGERFFEAAYGDEIFPPQG
ncbi:MAG: two-component system regulatory protein YycI [Clostridiales bacterium]|nr:two-component system regulatory protein YycI [Clostridiales bacterium]